MKEKGGYMEICTIMENTDITNQDMIENIINQYSTQIKRLAFTYVRDWAVSDDITQEVLIICYEKLNTYRGEGDIKNWLFKITVNKCKDYLRGKWYKRIIPVDGKWEDYGSESTSSEDSFFKKNEAAELSKKVLSLPMKYREVIILFYYEGLKIREMVELLVVKEQTIKTRLSRARKMLEKMIKESEEWKNN
jgi:RNA polymerase sigma-70 factor, ECF subfamily